MEWEDIDEWHKRARVPGGWLVKTYEDVMHVAPDYGDHNYFKSGYDWRVSMCFVPNPDHSWVIQK